MTRPTGYLVMRERCDECLFTTERIVSNRRAGEILRDVEKSDSYFVCHKASLAGRDDVQCRGDYDARPHSRPARLARALGLNPRFVTEAELTENKTMDMTTPSPKTDRTGTRAPTTIDAAVGAKVRVARKIAGISQSDLGAAIGVTYQQVQKYENGTDRMSVGRLAHIAQILGQPIAFFLDDVSDAGAAMSRIPEEAARAIGYLEPMTPAGRAAALSILRVLAQTDDLRREPMV